MGTLLGGATSGLQTAQDYVGRLRAMQDGEPRLSTALPPVTVTQTGSISVLKEGVNVDRGLKMGERSDGVPVDETKAESDSVERGSWYSWIPGLGK